MSLDPLALAYQGIGFHPTVAARLGLWEVPQTRVVKGKGYVRPGQDDDDIDLSQIDEEEVLEIIRVFLHLRSL